MILLTNIDELNLLRKLRKQIIVTPEICKEYRKSLTHWIEIKSHKDK